MLPETEYDLSGDYELEEEPTPTWKLHADSGRIAGMTDGADAMRQAISCILQTERYDSLIYSWEYGVELKDLFGRPFSFVLPELKRRVTEALMQDARISDVRDISFDLETRGCVCMAFTVETIYGEIRATKEVYV